jgi:hypothetical protein
MTVRQLPLPKFQIDKSDGSPASGWKIYTYEPGTTTAKATYTTSAGTVANANPVVLDARGEADIWWDGLYKVVVKDENDVTIYTVDNHGTGLTPVSSTQLSLVPNYSFEEATDDATTPDNWTITLYTDGTQTLDTSAGNQIHGAKSLKFTSTGSGGGYATSAIFPVQEAVAVIVNIAIKSSTAGVRNVIEVIWYDRAEVLVSTTSIYDNSTTNPTAWTDQSISATPPSNARFAKIRITGCHSSDSTTGSTWFDNVRVVNQNVGIGQIVVTRKTADESVTSSATLQDDDELTFAIAASEVWQFEAELLVTGTFANHGWAYQVNAPAGAGGRIGQTFLIGSNVNGTNAGPSAGQSIAAASFVAAGGGVVRIAGTVVNSTTAGNVTIQWAQGTSSGSALSVLAGSYLKRMRVA